MQLFDTHAHLDDEQLAPLLDDVLDRARRAGVVGMVAIGTTAPSSRACCELAERHEGVYAAVGIQPNYTAEAAEGDWQRVVELASREVVCAIGETGLDCYWDHSPLAIQRDYFDRHLRLAARLERPFVVHMRESAAPVLEMLQEAAGRGPLRGIMHSFTGDWTLARQCLDLGMHISFAGMVTFKKSAELRHVAARIPADRLLIETDAPYLTPHPHRGRRPNEPAMIVHTARCIAEARQISLEELAAVTTENARRLFGLET